jgi:acyl-CoA dehydrogenase
MMNHTLTLLDDSVVRALGDVVTARGTADAESRGIDERAWAQLHALGVAGPHAAEMSLAELAVVASAAARAAALVPYVESEAIARWLAADADIELGDEIAAVAVVPRTGTDGRTLPIDGLCIPWAACAQSVLFSFGTGGRSFVAKVPRQRLELRAMASLAGEPHGRVIGSLTLAEAEVHEVSEARGPQAVLLRGALFRSVQMVAAMSQVNSLALQYSRDRKQFRRPLSDFQVIQSHLAAMAGELCAASVAVDVALDAAAPDEAADAIATAKVRAGQAARQICALGHQVHGAIGFTQEYPLHLWTRRLWSWRDEFGNESHWAQELGRRACERGADALWDTLTRQGATHG